MRDPRNMHDHFVACHYISTCCWFAMPYEHRTPVDANAWEFSGLKESPSVTARGRMLKAPRDVNSGSKLKLLQRQEEGNDSLRNRITKTLSYSFLLMLLPCIS